MTIKNKYELSQGATGANADWCSMRTLIFPILAGLCDRPYNGVQLKSELNQILKEIRSNSNLAQKIIPENIDEMTTERLDWTVTVVWLMMAQETIDFSVLLRLDAIGASLNLDGCIQRLHLQVVDALQEGRPQN